MRKQQSNHKGTKRNSKGWRKPADTGHEHRTHTYTHNYLCRHMAHHEQEQNLTRGPKGHPSCVRKRKGYRHFGEGGQKKKPTSPSHHHSQQADLGEQAPLTPSVLSPPHVELSPPEGLQESHCALVGCAGGKGESPGLLCHHGRVYLDSTLPPVPPFLPQKGCSWVAGAPLRLTSFLWQTSVFGLEYIFLSKSLTSCNGLSTASFLS